MGVLWRCSDGFFEVVLAGWRRQGREGRGGTTFFARCGRPGRCWPSGRGCRTMARQDYSVALLFQLAVWTTLQFRRLRIAVTITLLFLKRALHSTLQQPSTVQLVRGSLIESLDRGSNHLVILGKGLGPHMSSHSPLGPRIWGPGYRWLEDSSRKAGSSHMSSHGSLRPRIPGTGALKTIQLTKGQDPRDWIV